MRSSSSRHRSPRRPRSSSPRRESAVTGPGRAGPATGRTTYPRLHPALDGIALVVFDKDGTLIEFDAMWAPWARQLAAALEHATGRRVARPLFELMGFDPETGRTTAGGGLSGTPMTVLRDRT